MGKDYKKELDSGLTPLTIVEEASRCLLCHDAPCSKMCPAQTDPAKFIRSVRFRNFKGAAETIRINNILGGVCSRVCPTEKLCQLACSRTGIDKPIEIGKIQRFVTDFEDAVGMEVIEKPVLDKKETVAIVGSGPSGLTLASELLQKGYHVTMFEKDEKLGGFLRYGIPEYRLPNSIVDKEVNRIVNFGLEVKTGVEVGKDITLEELKKQFDVVALGLGITKSKYLPMFENNEYVVSSIEYLKEIKDKEGNVEVPNNVVVIGGGDVSMDICTSLKILGSRNVTAVVFEELNEFKASKKELNDARREGVSIFDGFVPVECKDNVVKFKHRFIDTEVVFKADKIVLAIGQVVENENFKDLEWNCNEVKSDNYHVKDNIFVIGDISENKEKSVVGAVKSGKEAAKAIVEFLGGK